MQLSLEDFIARELDAMARRLLREGYATLADLPYEKYLRSVLWTRITEWVLERDQNRCQICQGKPFTKFNPLEVHHRSYDLATLEGRRPDQLVSLCNGCHKRIEFYSDERKRTALVEKNVELERLKQLHASIREQRLPVRIVKPKTTLKEFHYVGDPSYLEFYPVAMLGNHLLHRLYLKHRDVLRLPMGSSNEMIKNPSGARVLSKEKSAKWFTFLLRDQTVVLKVSRACVIDVDAWLPCALESEEQHPTYWYAA